MGSQDSPPSSPKPVNDNPDYTPWSVTTEPPRGRRKTIYLRARRTNRKTGKREEIRPSSFTTDPVEAQRLAEEWEARLNGMSVEADPTVLAVMDARINAMKSNPKVRPGTLAKYHRVRKILASIPFSGVRASELRSKHLIDAQEAIKAGGHHGRANSTVNTTLAIVGATWGWAKKKELVTTSWPEIGALDTREPARPKRAYTAAEVEAVLDYIRVHESTWHPPFAFLAATGARLNDILKLRGRDVMWSEQLLLLRLPKTGAPKWVGIAKEVLALVEQPTPDACLFPSRVKARAGQPVTASGALRCLRRALRALQIPDPEWLDLHSFRRSACAQLEEAGVPRHQAMKLTGHTSGKMYDHYASMAGSQLRETAEALHAYRKRMKAERERETVGQGTTPVSSAPPSATCAMPLSPDSPVMEQGRGVA